MKQILVSGSTAYDTYLHHEGSFQKQFLGGIPAGLNMSLVAHRLEKNEGGTGANIAYNLALLGEHAVLLTSIGIDYSFDGPILEKINLKYVHKSRTGESSNSIIFSDNDDNRITMFYPGVMVEASHSKVSYVSEDIGLALVSANHIPTMLEHARELKARGIPFFADPAQQISQMTQEELREFIDLADYLIVNHYEFQELQTRATLSDEDLTEKLKIIIVTYGAQGSQLLEKGSMIHIPAIEVPHMEDSTGAGDAYRAGVLKAHIEGYDWKTACQLGTVLASYCILTSGSQTHHFSYGGVAEDMKKYFGVDLDLYNKRKY